ncbi:hypothetical protein HPB51_027874 [Rhipicephalus microplus]|uniref:Uncharacterized protein n=1 Tax=Rhipicephalus microplus TaxID=6941 RepID=A0A9J6CZ36_RHIMP|nr:hypothetical protein HPB51_027874 [Rhipicephalus microplus]
MQPKQPGFDTATCGESSSRRHPAYGTTQSLTIHCVELGTCWAVPVAAACITFLSCIVSSSYGYLYVLLIKELHVKRKESALPETAFVISGGSVGAGVGTTLRGVTMYLLLYFDKYKATATAIKDIGHGRSRYGRRSIDVTLYNEVRSERQPSSKRRFEHAHIAASNDYQDTSLFSNLPR